MIQDKTYISAQDLGIALTLFTDNWVHTKQLS